MTLHHACKQAQHTTNRVILYPILELVRTTLPLKMVWFLFMATLSSVESWSY